MTDDYLLLENISWAALLLASYRRYLGSDLIPPGSPKAQAEALFYAPFAVLSHGTQPDPIFNYGNQTTLDLWEIDWPTFTQMPSRLSTEPVLREERAHLLAELNRKNYFENGKGIRISSQGRRFFVKNFTLWNVIDEAGTWRGQAAMFSEWAFLD